MSALGPNPHPISATSDRRERSDTFAGEVLRRGDWRVTFCGNGLQWLLQHRHSRPQENAGGAWDSVAFCRTRPALPRLWRANTGYDGAMQEQQLTAYVTTVRHGR